MRAEDQLSPGAAYQILRWHYQCCTRHRENWTTRRRYPWRFVIVAVNCLVCEASIVVLAGATATDTGGYSVTLATASAAPSAVSAMIVTSCCESMVAGAVYRPVLSSVPTPDG